MENYLIYLQTLLAIITSVLLFREKKKKNKLDKSSKWFKIILVAIVILSLLFIVFLILRNDIVIDESVKYISYIRYLILIVWVSVLLVMLLKKVNKRIRLIIKADSFILIVFSNDKILYKIISLKIQSNV